MQPYRPRVTRKIYRIEVSVERVVDLSGMSALAPLGIDEWSLAGSDMSACQRVGAAVAWLGFGGLLVPSARAEGSNLVIYVGNLGVEARFEEIACTVVRSPSEAR